jgi:hypothetical protein
LKWSVCLSTSSFGLIGHHSKVLQCRLGVFGCVEQAVVSPTL